MKRSLLILASLLLIVAPQLCAQVDTSVMRPSETISKPLPVLPAPPTNVKAEDNANDNGHSIKITWSLSVDDTMGLKNVALYKIYRASSADAPDSLWKERGPAIKGISTYTDRGSRDSSSAAYLAKNTEFYYRVHAVSLDTFSVSAASNAAKAEDDWFNTGRVLALLFVIMFVLLTMWFIKVAKSGKTLYVRPLAGIDAVDEAIGRATEMGRPILYVLGLGTASDIATIASFSVLGRVAKRVAEYQTPILVPCYDPIVLTVAEETVRTGYSDAGRPEDYKEDSVYFVTQSQFAYVAAVNGTMLRLLPATNIYLGKFYAESLLLAETGAVAGSIQIAGTDEIAQLPFFVVACDYTLIGEELYAASVYLNREPILLGTLKAQDYAKGVVILSILAGLVIRFFTSKEFMAILFQVES